MAKTNKTIYKITLPNFDKYNSKKKKGHPCVMISCGFLDDAKVSTLPLGGKLLFLGLILRCGEVADRSVQASHDLLVRLAGGSGQVVVRLLEQLEELQLVTVEKNESLYNRIEKKIKEKKIKEGSANSEEAPPDLDFEIVANEYPKRPGTGKGEGIKALTHQLHTPDDLELCRKAAANYRRYCELNHTDPKFIKQFKTWCGSVENPRWREWAEWAEPVVESLVDRLVREHEEYQKQKPGAGA